MDIIKPSIFSPIVPEYPKHTSDKIKAIMPVIPHTEANNVELLKSILE